MALHTLKHRDVAQIHRMLKWLVCLVAVFAFVLNESTQIYGMYEWSSLN